MKRTILICGLMLSLVRVAPAQGLDPSPNAQTGHLPSGSYFSGDIDSVSNYNGNVMLDIPLFTLPGREISQGLRLTYNSQKWQSVGSGSSVHGYYTGGWQIADPAGSLRFQDDLLYCNESQAEGTWRTNAVWLDSTGTRHFFIGADTTGSCDQGNPPDVQLNSTDGLRTILHSTSTQRILVFQDGTVIDFTPTLSSTPGQAVFRTANGNFIKSGMASDPQPDTLGRTVGYCTNKISACIGDNASDGTTYFKRYTITAANGSAQNYYLIYYYHHTVTDPWYNGGGSASVTLDDWLDSIKLPNGQYYRFEYNHSQGFLTKVTMPSGAYIRYLYHSCTSSNSCSDGNPAHDDLDQRILSADGIREQTWAYSRNTSNPERIVTLTNPDSSTIEHTFNSAGLEKVTRWLQSGTTEMQQVTTSWMAAGTNFLPYPIAVFTKVGSKQRQTVYTYDGSFHVTRVDESDWSAIGNVVPLSRTNNTYVFLFSTGRQVLGTVEVQGWVSGAYVTQGKTQYLYDEGSPMATPSSVPNKGEAFGDRGNVTTILHFTGTPTYVSETFSYDDLGNVIEHRDPLNRGTTISFADKFHNSGNNGSTFAYPTLMTNAKGQTVHVEYDFHTGAITTVTDVRGQDTTSTYDPLNRPYQISQPGGRVTTYTYNDSSHTVTQDVLVAAGKYRTSKVFTDGLFRPIEVVQSDPAGDVHVVTYYDGNGRVYQASVPHRTGDPVAYTTSTYDVLDRPLTITNPDNSTVRFSYSDNTVTMTDEADVQRRQTVNGIGQLTKVEESNPTLGSPVTTIYTYDVTGPLRKVEQSLQTRTYTYDWIGRLLAEDHPETGVTSYAYDPAGNLTRRTDARGVNADYTYDEISRLLTATYSDGTPSVTNIYDQTYIGLLTTAIVGSPGTPRSTTAYAYNNAGLVMSEARSFIGASGTFTSGYSYDYDGRLLNLTYPSGRVVAQSYASSGSHAVDRINSIIDNTTSNTILGAVSTNAAGQVTSRTLGSGTVIAQSFNNRNQLTNITASQSSTNLFKMDYSYTAGGAANVGRIRARIDNVQPEHSVAYVYDSRYRLKEANGSSTPWSVRWTMDDYGNRTTQTATGMASSLGNQSIGIDPTTNRRNDTGVTYDGAGNMTNDGSHSYTYDGEGRLKSAFSGSVQYEYDEAGRRIKTTTSSGTTYSIYGLTGLQSQFTTTSTGATVAASTDRLEYRVPEQTGTGVLVISASGNVLENNRVFPYGEPWRATSISTNSEKFTTYQRDQTTNLDYAMARDYASQSGRFMTPDPGHVGANIGDPQSWNAYVYANGDPINQTDSTGRDCISLDHFAENGVVSLQRGGCDSFEGFYVDGSVSEDIFYDRDRRTLRYTFTFGEGIGVGVIDMSRRNNDDLDAKGLAFVYGMADRADASNEMIAALAGVSAAGGAAPAAAGAASGLVAQAGSLITRGVATGVGWAYGSLGGTGVVLGTHPEYVQEARAMGANAFNLPMWLWQGLNAVGQSWTANRAFLDASISKGQQFYLSEAPLLNSGGATFMKELQYLASRGIGPDQWIMIGR